MQVFTLVALVAAIFIGYVRKVNTGLVGLGVAYLVGYFLVGIDAKTIIAGFPTSLFFILMGMTLLFSIAKSNGTMEIIAKKVSKLANGRTKLIPILFFIMSTIIAALGPGTIVVPALMLPIAMEVAKKEDISDLLMSTIIICGALAGGLSPLAPTGIIGVSLAAEIGVMNYTPIFLGCIIVSTLQAALVYFIFGGHKLKNKVSGENEDLKINTKQVQTLVVIGSVILAILIFGFDIGLTAFTGAAILLILGVANTDDAIKGISWSTLLLVSGVAVLVNVVKIAGGIDTLSTFLAGIMTETTAGPLMSLMAGLMSAVSSASGVVMPTLIPTIPGIVDTLGSGITPTSLVAAVCIGSHAVTFSPLSTLGALAMANATDRVDRDKLFTQLLIAGIASLIFASLLGFVGIFNINI